MNSKSRPRAAIFVDVQNIYYTCKEVFSASFDYRQLMSNLTKEFELSHAYAYAIDSHNDGQKKFQKALRSMGFEVKLKPFIQRHDGSAKGDWDVGITIDMMRLAEQVDHLILMSGDGDFDRLLLHIKSHHATTSQVISVEALSAYSLIRSCDIYTAINESMLQG